MAQLARAHAEREPRAQHRQHARRPPSCAASAATYHGQRIPARRLRAGEDEHAAPGARLNQASAGAISVAPEVEPPRRAAASRSQSIARERDEQRHERRRQQQQQRHEHELRRDHDPRAGRELDARHHRVGDDHEQAGEQRVEGARRGRQHRQRHRRDRNRTANGDEPSARARRAASARAARIGEEPLDCAVGARTSCRRVLPYAPATGGRRMSYLVGNLTYRLEV